MSKGVVAPRRSGRERNKPKDIYQISPSSTNSMLIDEDAENVAPSESSSSENDDDSDSIQTPRKRSKVGNKKKKDITKKKEELKNSGEDSEEDDLLEGSLFEAIHRPSSAIDSIVSEWIERYQEEKESEENGKAALVDLFNFILQSCGAVKQHLKTPEALAQLDMSTVVQRVALDLAEQPPSTVASGEYPLVGKSKNMRKFRQNLTHFWKTLLSECCANDAMLESDLIEVLTDWLTALSSANVRAVRHTSMCTAFEICTALLESQRKVGHQLEIYERQLSAEMKKKTKSKTSANKIDQMKGNIAFSTETMTVLHKSSQLIFNGIFVHRYRDTVPDIRVRSLESLAEWILTYPHEYLKDNYLKYIGWMLNDTHANVRLAAVLSLTRLYDADNGLSIDKMELFTSRFIPRMIEMADDVDNDVVLAALKLVTVIDTVGFLDGDMDTSRLERLVFDSDDSSEAIRQAAARFVCLQYDAFGTLESAANNPTAVEIHQVTQTLALVEFFEEHLQVDRQLELIDLAVEAFWSTTEDCSVLSNWHVLTEALLTEESDRVLTLEQQMILARVILACLKKAKSSDRVSQHNTANSKKNKSSTTLQEKATIHFCTQLQALFQRFQSDDQVLISLVQYLQYFAFTSTVLSTKEISRHLEEIVQRHGQLFRTHQNLNLLEEISMTVEFLTTSSSDSSPELFSFATALSHSLMHELIEKLPALYKQASSSSSSSQEDEVQYQLLISVQRLRCLLKTNVAKSLEDLMDGDSKTNNPVRIVMQSIGEYFKHLGHQTSSMHAHMIQIESLNVLFLWISWSTQAHLRVSNEESNEPHPTTFVDQLVEDREILFQVFHSIFSLLNPMEENENENEMKTDDSDAMDWNVSLQSHALELYCDTRCLFTTQFAHSIDLSPLVWTPSLPLRNRVDVFFHYTVSAQEDAEHHLTAYAKSCLVNPNQKQEAAQVLEHIVTVHDLHRPESEKIVRQFAKEIKASAPIKYLEMQMTALRRTFEEEAEGEGNFERTKAMAKRFSSTLGIGVVAMSLRQPLVRFLSEGMRFGFENPPSHFAFLEVMRSYLSHANVSMKRQLAGQFEALSTLDSLESEMLSSFEKALEVRGSLRPLHRLKRKSAGKDAAGAQSKRRISLGSVGGSSPQSILSSNHLADIQEHDDVSEMEDHSQVSMDKVGSPSPLGQDKECESPSVASPQSSKSPTSSVTSSSSE